MTLDDLMDNNKKSRAVRRFVGAERRAARLCYSIAFRLRPALVRCTHEFTINGMGLHESPRDRTVRASGLQLIDFVGVVAYLLVTGRALSSGRRGGKVEHRGVLLGGRRMPWWPLA